MVTDESYPWTLQRDKGAGWTSDLAILVAVITAPLTARRQFFVKFDSQSSKEAPGLSSLVILKNSVKSKTILPLYLSALANQKFIWSLKTSPSLATVLEFEIEKGQSQA